MSDHLLSLAVLLGSLGGLLGYRVGRVLDATRRRDRE